MEPPKDQNKTIELFKQGPDILKNSIAGLSESELDYAPSSGGWSIREIVHHLADGDDIWKSAIKMAMGGLKSEFSLKWYTALPQTEWAIRWSYEKRSVDVSLAFLKATRDHVLQLLENAPESWNMSVDFPTADRKIEVVPVGFIVQMQADHIAHHVKRIQEIRQEMDGE